jgi:hypothetical protein
MSFLAWSSAWSAEAGRRINALSSAGDAGDCSAAVRADEKKKQEQNVTKRRAGCVFFMGEGDEATWEFISTPRPRRLLKIKGRTQ